jgi:hypothetical protein
LAFPAPNPQSPICLAEWKSIQPSEILVNGYLQEASFIDFLPLSVAKLLEDGGIETSLVTVHVLATNLLWIANYEGIPGKICVYFSGADILTPFKLRQNPSGFDLTLEGFAKRFRRLHYLIEGIGEDPFKNCWHMLNGFKQCDTVLVDDSLLFSKVAQLQ